MDEALNLLFVGETNRVVCETPSNDASTRSHCIFIISLEVRTSDGKVRRSKLNLVDCEWAGGARVEGAGSVCVFFVRARSFHLSVRCFCFSSPSPRSGRIRAREKNRRGRQDPHRGVPGA